MNSQNPRHLAIALLAVLTGASARADLVGYYTFEGNANDSSGHGNHGTLSPVAPVLTAAGGGYTGNGNANSHAYQFGTGSTYTDPNNSFITVTINIDPSSMPLVTFGAWVKADQTDSVIRGIISHDNGGFDRTIDVDNRADGIARWSFFTGSGTYSLVSSAAVTTNWTFLAARYNTVTNEAQFTINGFNTGVFNAVMGPGLSNTTIGRNPRFDMPFSGLIDNVFFYDEYLTNAQITDIYQNGVAPTATPEPSTFALGFGALTVLVVARRRRGGR